MRIQILTAALLCTSSMVHAGTVTLAENGQFGEFSASGSLDVEERIVPFDDSDDAPVFFPSDVGIYDVANNTGGNLMGFGVSNNGTLPAIFENGPDGRPGPVGCTDSPGYLICYETLILNAGNWNEETAFTTFEEVTLMPASTNVEKPVFDDYPIGIIQVDYTFQDIFGDFATVSGGDDMFNWFQISDFEIFEERKPVLEMTAFNVIEETMDMYTEIMPIYPSPLANGDSADDFFGFLDGVLASSIIGHSANQNGNSFFTAGQAVPPAVPLPAAAWMLMAGIGGLGAIARRKKA